MLHFLISEETFAIQQYQVYYCRALSPTCDSKLMFRMRFYVVFQVFGQFVYEANDSCKDQLDKQQRVKAGSCHLAFLAPDGD